MNISSTPFIRNDYWPDYNDIDILNKRIDEAENETSLVNSRLTNDIENVSNNLNSYKNAMADTVITNNIIVNNLNANYAVGKYANFANTNTDNAYIENLTVNKPVFDITLNTPHVENITSIGGNFYDANLFNVAVENITGSINGSTITNSTLVNAMLDGNGVLGNVEINNAVINTANVAELFVNTQPEPVTSSAILGYDIEGRVIPVKASFEVGFPENANYLYTDQYGTAFPGTAETEVNASDNLITSYAVYNALANVNNSFNAVNQFVNNGFNDVNNFVNNGLNNVNNSFNNVNNRFGDVANNFNDVNNTANNLLDNVDYLKTALAPLLNLTPANVSGWINSTSPVNIQGITSFVVAPFAVPAMLSSTDVGDGAKLDVTGTTARLGLPGFQWTMGTMKETFFQCYSLNQAIQIPVGVTSMINTFSGCTNFNQNILIPNSVTCLFEAFGGVAFGPDYNVVSCSNLNQNILIPNSVTNMTKTFKGCKNLNQPNMYIFSQNVIAMANAFNGCHINNIHIPTSVPKDTSNFMYNCLVNGNTGITFPASNIFNDLPVDMSIYKEQFIELSVDLEHEYRLTINPETYDSSWSVTNGGSLQDGFFIYKDGNSIEYLGYIKFNSSSQIAEGDAYGRTAKIYSITSPGTLTQLFGDVSVNKQALPIGTLVTTDNGKVYRKLEPGEWS